MSEAPGPAVDELPVPTTASGDSYFTTIHNFLQSGPPPEFLSPPAAPRHQVADAQLSSLQQRFARPPGINDAYDTLERHNIVFLHGTPGNGRASAARVLLRELPRGSGVYKEIVPVPKGQSPELLAPELVGKADRMLLNLSEAKEDMWTAYHDQFPGFYKVLLDKRSFLAVVLPQTFADRLSPDFSPYRKPVNRPDALEVITRHLRMQGIDISDPEQIPKELTGYLVNDPKPMSELAKLSDSIVEAHGTAKPGTSLADWCRQAIATSKVRAEKENDFVPTPRKGSQRALLLTVAMLHGAPADVIHRAAAALQDNLGIAADDRPLLEHQGLAERLRRVGASRHEDRVCFDKLRYDDAVRRHFWRNMPDLRRPLRDWVSEVLALPQFPAEHQRALVVRLAELCASTEEEKKLADQAWEWAQLHDDTAHMRAAAEWLSWGIRHDQESTSRQFRAAVLNWSKKPIGTRLRKVLIEVCANVLAFTHPDQAVVRLHHLARREPQGRQAGRNPARQVLLRLVAPDTRLQLYLLYRLVSKAAPLPEQQRRLDAWLFLGLLTMPTQPEHVFLRLAPTRLWLARCWTDVLQSFDSASWLPRMKRWVVTTAAAEDQKLVGHALEVLVDAAAEDYPAMSRIYLTVRKSLSADKAEQLLARAQEAQRVRLSRRAEPEKGAQS
ncbi:hypothetical protein [Streptomyces sp. NPDC058954]|uniref:hypothetical protein n=1 Tax=Streptomyces sp. NPDC058954 TaxID=3346677 RepID=UPI003686EE6C